ncbi:MAG TPA: N-acetylmuramoyl-L-alanine amidase [Anaerolineae bacterium]|nr:N-acetylmuramoyl-L-alanine amidase [Anaerolineae bacterium]
MNKLGFYIENTTVRWLREALRQVKPPVILIHAQDRGLLRDIRRELSPDSFIIGRLFKTPQQQHFWLDSGEPERYGREFAEEIINYDFQLAKEVGENGRLLIDAWMSLNEAIRGPASFPGYEVDDEFRRRADAYDRFMVAFKERLDEEGLEAVAFNFAAGNFTKPEHYLDWFPRTLEAYTYLGFHEYGWPALKPGPGVHTAALYYRTCMEGIRQQYGDKFKVIMTEAGLTMAYGNPQNPDEGWLNTREPLTEEQYWQSLLWYNNEMLKDPYVMGACLFEVGHAGKWVTFRHLGEDNQGNPILLMNRIEALNDIPGPPEPPEPPEPPSGDIYERTAALVDALTRERDRIAEVPALADEVELALAPLAGPAGAAIETEMLAHNLRTRVNQISATLTQLEDHPDIPAETLQRMQQEADLVAQQLDALAPRIARVEAAGRDVQTVAQAFPAQKRAAQQTPGLLTQVESLLERAQRLQSDLPGGEFTPPPGVQDIRDQMPHHPTKTWPSRTLNQIEIIVVHHTVTSSQIDPIALARAIIARRDLPGLPYHFLVQGDGSGFWTESLETALGQTLKDDINRTGVAVALAGNFTNNPPPEAQLDTAAAIIAQLVKTYNLNVEEDIIGRSEVDPVASPGRQWLQGARYKFTLLEKVRALL